MGDSPLPDFYFSPAWSPDQFMGFVASMTPEQRYMAQTYWQSAGPSEATNPFGLTPPGTTLATGTTPRGTTPARDDTTQTTFPPQPEPLRSKMSSSRRRRSRGSSSSGGGVVVVVARQMPRHHHVHVHHFLQWVALPWVHLAHLGVHMIMMTPRFIGSRMRHQSWIVPGRTCVHVSISCAPYSLGVRSW